MTASLLLSAAERELLLNLLTNRIGELREEIHHATVASFKDELKQTEVQMKGLLAKIEASSAASE